MFPEVRRKNVEFLLFEDSWMYAWCAEIKLNVALLTLRRLNMSDVSTSSIIQSTISAGGLLKTMVKKIRCRFVV